MDHMELQSQFPNASRTNVRLQAVGSHSRGAVKSRDGCSVGLGSLIKGRADKTIPDTPHKHIYGWTI